MYPHSLIVRSAPLMIASQPGRMVCLLLLSEISSFVLAPAAEKNGLRLAWSENPKAIISKRA